MDKKVRYLKNTPTSHNRNIRLEVTGEVTAVERQFLNGMAFFMAGVLSKADDGFTKEASAMMVKALKLFRSEHKE